jgi:hypothetical protein
MRLAKSLAVLAIAGAGCHTIHEELPTRASVVSTPGGTAQVIIVAPPAAPVASTPVPAPSSAPAPVPVASSAPVPSGGGGDFPNNNSPVARLNIKVYFVECNGQQVPGSEYASSASVGCRIHLDCTPRDASNQPTRARGTPEWSYSDTSLVKPGGGSPYNPVLNVKGVGNISVQASVDGVSSNVLGIALVP